MSDLDIQIDIVLDSEVIAISNVMNKLNHTVAFSSRKPESVQREMIERFHEINFNATVTWTEDAAGYSIPKIQLNSRVDGSVFDHDRMRYEVQSGMLNGDPGAIGANGTVVSPSKSTAGFWPKSEPKV